MLRAALLGLEVGGLGGDHLEIVDRALPVAGQRQVLGALRRRRPRRPASRASVGQVVEQGQVVLDLLEGAQHRRRGSRRWPRRSSALAARQLRRWRRPPSNRVSASVRAERPVAVGRGQPGRRRRCSGSRAERRRVMVGIEGRPRHADLGVGRRRPAARPRRCRAGAAAASRARPTGTSRQRRAAGRRREREARGRLADQAGDGVLVERALARRRPTTWACARLAAGSGRGRRRGRRRRRRRAGPRSASSARGVGVDRVGQQLRLGVEAAQAEIVVGQLAPPG